MTIPPPVADPVLVGSFHYSSATDTLTWSDPVYLMHGFRPGDVVPSVDLVLSHKHPEDRDEAARAIQRVCATGEPFSCWHRIVDAAGAQRHVLSVGAGTFDDHGFVTGYAGYISDVSEMLRRSVNREVEEALDGLSRSRPTIEQVKGALMITYALDPDAAFELLRRYSQLANVKVRDVAREFAEAMADGDFPQGARPTWDELAGGVRGSTRDGRAGQAAAD
ncbi:MAG: PAS and ANTAR domain-containing protein [Nocardioidaceae bacterium]